MIILFTTYASRGIFQIMVRGNIWQHSVNFAFAMLLLVLGIMCWWVFHNQTILQYEIIKHIQDSESRVVSMHSAIIQELDGEIMKLENMLKKKLVYLDSKSNLNLKKLEEKLFAKSQQEVIAWSRGLVKKGFKVFSQNDEDGAIEAVFDYIGTTDKVYVEFGVESCIECNSRYLR